MSLSPSIPRASLLHFPSERSPLIELVSRCIQPRNDSSAGSSSLAASAAKIENWEACVAWAAPHGLLPLLTTRLQSAGWPSVPAPLRAKLQHHYLGRAKHGLLLVAALLQALEVFDDAGVHAVCWKGPALAFDLYGNTIDREFTDLDFLVSDHQSLHAEKALESLGYVHHEKTASHTFNERIARAERDACFVRASDGAYIELHTETMPARYVCWQDAQTLHERAIPLALPSGHTVQYPAPPDLLFSLCGHGLKHSWEHLKWVVDLALFVQRYRSSMDWPGMLREARQTGKNFAVQHSLRLACSLFSLTLPDGLEMSPAENRRVAKITQEVVDHFASGSPALLPEGMTAALAGLLFPTTVSRLRFTADRAFEPRLADFNDTSSRSPLVAKWRRLLRDTGPRATLHKTVHAFRRIW